MDLKNFFLLLCSSCILFLAFGQAHGQPNRFMRTYAFTPGESSRETIQDMVQLPGGDLVLAGYSATCAGLMAGPAVGPFAAIMRTTEEGTPVWVRRFGHDSLSCYPWSMTLGNDGNLVLTAQYHNNLLVLKMDLNGNMIWHRDIAMGGAIGKNYILAAHGGYYVSAMAQSTNLGAVGALFRIEESGTYSWMRVFQYPQNQPVDFHNIFLKSNGNLLVNAVGGGISGPTPYNYLNPTLEFDPSGNFVQGREYWDTTGTRANAIWDAFQTSDGGQLKLEPGGVSTEFLTKLDEGGKVLWALQLNHSWCDLHDFKVVQDQFGIIFVTALYSNFSISGPDKYSTYLLRMDPEGNVLDEKTMDFDRYQRVNRLYLAEGCGVYAAGQIYGGAIPGALAIGRMDSSGNPGNAVPVSLVTVQPAPLMSRSFTIAEVSLPYLSGTPPLITDTQMPVVDTTLLSSPMPVCNLVSAAAYTAHDHWAIGPNPCGEELRIDLGSGPGKARVTLYDLSGKSLLSREMAGSRLTIPMTGISPGIYLLRIEGKTETVARKIVKY